MDDQLTQTVIETVKSYQENFEWTPSSSLDPVGRENLIRELKDGGRIGRMFIEEIKQRLIQRMHRDKEKYLKHLKEFNSLPKKIDRLLAKMHKLA